MIAGKRIRSKLPYQLKFCVFAGLLFGETAFLLARIHRTTFNQLVQILVRDVRDSTIIDIEGKKYRLLWRCQYFLTQTYFPPFAPAYLL